MKFVKNYPGFTKFPADAAEFLTWLHRVEGVPFGALATESWAFWRDVFWGLRDKMIPCRENDIILAPEWR